MLNDGKVTYHSLAVEIDHPSFLDLYQPRTQATDSLNPRPLTFLFPSGKEVL